MDVNLRPLGAEGTLNDGREAAAAAKPQGRRRFKSCRFICTLVFLSICKMQHAVENI